MSHWFVLATGFGGFGSSCAHLRAVRSPARRGSSAGFAFTRPASGTRTSRELGRLAGRAVFTPVLGPLPWRYRYSLPRLIASPRSASRSRCENLGTVRSRASRRASSRRSSPPPVPGLSAAHTPPGVDRLSQTVCVSPLNAADVAGTVTTTRRGGASAIPTGPRRAARPVTPRGAARPSIAARRARCGTVPWLAMLRSILCTSRARDSCRVKFIWRSKGATE